MRKIKPVCAFNDNYIWMGVNEETKQAFAVDPGEAKPVLEFLREHQLDLTAILVTHKHPDHTGGIQELLQHFKHAVVYAHPTEQVAAVTHLVNDGDLVAVPGWDEPFHVVHIPGHTLGHVAYYNSQVLFCGDTLFAAGCGRVFEGTALQMLTSLQKLAALPAHTLVYCGHEYTLSNLKFAQVVEPLNTKIQERLAATTIMRERGEPSLPSMINLELETNPFLRCNEMSVQAAVASQVNQKLDAVVDVFHELREWKNRF